MKRIIGLYATQYKVKVGVKLYYNYVMLLTLYSWLATSSAFTILEVNQLIDVS